MLKLKYATTNQTVIFVLLVRAVLSKLFGTEQRSDCTFERCPSQTQQDLVRTFHFL